MLRIFLSDLFARISTIKYILLFLSLYFINLATLSAQSTILIQDEHWIEIDDMEKLSKIGSAGFPLDGKYIQTKNIDLTDYNIEGGGWVSIGTVRNGIQSFEGIYNGGNFSIKGLTINRSGVNHALFAKVGENGLLKNIRLIDVDINVLENTRYNAALVGENLGGISDCAAINGKITALRFSGGLVGQNKGIIERCYSGVSIDGNEYLGGLVGENDNGGTIQNSYASGKVEGSDIIGGLVGRNRSVGSKQISYIINSYSSGKVIFTERGGGLIGLNSGMVKNSYWNTETSQYNINENEKVGEVEGKTDGEMRNSNTFKTWNFEEIWQIREGVSMPFLTSIGEFEPIEKEIPDLHFLLNGNEIVPEDLIEVSYGDVLEISILSDSLIDISNIESRLSNSEILDGSSLLELRAIKVGYTSLQILLKETTNFQGKEVTFNIVVNKKLLIVSPIQEQTKIYGDQDPTLEFDFKGFVNQDDGSLFFGKLGRRSGENVGNYEIILNGLHAGNNYNVMLDTNRVNFKILPREVSIKINPQRKMYNEADPSFTFDIIGQDLLEGDTILGKLQRVEGEDVGIYAITQGSLTLGENYFMVIEEGIFTISPAVSIITADSIQVYVYDGLPKSIAAHLNHTEAELLYAPIKFYTDAGEYEIKIRAPKTKNYQSDERTIVLKIEKAESEIMVDTIQVYEYNGLPKSIVANLNHTEATLVYAPAMSYIDAGEYEIKIQAPETRNYRSGERTVILKIKKAKFEGVTFEDSEWVYNGEWRSLKITGLDSIKQKSLNIHYSNNVHKDAGVYMPNVTISAPNYETLIMQAHLTIHKAASKIIAESIQVHEYDGAPKYLKAELNHNEGGVIYYPTNSYTDAGEYIIDVVTNSTKNFIGDKKSITLIVEKASFENIKFEDKTFVYDGTPHTLKVSNLPKGASVDYENNHQVNAGYYEITAIVSKKNYNNKTLQGILKINKAKQKLTFNDVDRINLNADQVRLDINSNSNLPIQLYGDDNSVASLDGFNLRVHGIGTVRITASQKGDNNHFDAKPITREVIVYAESVDQLRVYKAISPNDDGINDFLIIEGIKEFPENRVQIFDIRGRIVFDIQGYNNDSLVFTGLSNTGSNSSLTDGTYFYVLSYRDDEKWKRQRGWIYLKTF